MRPQPPILVGLFVISGSILLLQIALTRVFAILLWHHLAYMVISVVMLGFGAAGSLLALRGTGARRAGIGRSLALLAAGYGLAVWAALRIAIGLEIDSLSLWADKSNLVRLAGLYGAIFMPFLLGGAAVGLALTRLAAFVHRLYFFDLLGSAAGGLAAVGLLARYGASSTVVFAGGLGMFAAGCFALAEGRRFFLAMLPAPLLAVAFCAAFAGGVPALGIPAWRWEVPYEPGKSFANQPADEIVRIPSATAEVAVGPDRPTLPIIGGDFGRGHLEAKSARLVGQDGTAPTMLFRDAADLGAFPFLEDTQTAAAYVALRAAGRPEPRVLVIGVGGGIDVMVALKFGAASVTAVDINRAMIRAVSQDFDAYLGGLFRPGAHRLSDRVELALGEGRSFVRHRGNRYDVIQMSGVDSFTALNTGAYTLSESYLYTTGAIRDFYEHLEEGGILAISRFIMRYPKKPRETLRLANVAYTGLEELGVEDPASRIAVLRGFHWASTLVKRGPFLPEELQALRRFAAEQGFWGMVFDPLVPADGSAPRPPPHFARTLAYRAEQSLLKGRFGAEVAPGAAARLGQAAATAQRHELAGRAAAAESALAVALETLPQRERESVAPGLRRWLGRQTDHVRRELGAFVAARRDFATLLRGKPAERRAFVEGYDYDVRPSTDDAPFFFNYYRYGGLLRAGLGQAGQRSSADYYHPDYPVGHAILLASLVQITALAALFILLPLRSLGRTGIRGGQRLRVFLYFASLGMGFMFIEIVLMQKLVLFLGHPTYAVSVVLTTLLAFAGLGALGSGRVTRLGPGTFRIGVGVLALFVLLDAALIDGLLPRLLGWGFAARIGLVVALLAPLGLVLGMPFPLGIRVVEARFPGLLPWAWAINAFLSVFSSIFCIVLAMAVGFSWVLWLAAGVYGVGALAFASLAAPQPSAE